jgi:hypothetical protein
VDHESQGENHEIEHGTLPAGAGMP